MKFTVSILEKSIYNYTYYSNHMKEKIVKKWENPPICFDLYK